MTFLFISRLLLFDTSYLARVSGSLIFMRLTTTRGPAFSRLLSLHTCGCQCLGLIGQDIETWWGPLSPSPSSYESVSGTTWSRRGSLLSSSSFFVIVALIEGKNLYICSEEKKNRQKAAIVIKLMIVTAKKNLLLKKIAILRIVDLADVGKGKTLKVKSSQET